MGRTADANRTDTDRALKAKAAGFEEMECPKCGEWQIKAVQIRNWFECQCCTHTFEQPLSATTPKSA